MESVQPVFGATSTFKPMPLEVSGEGLPDEVRAADDPLFVAMGLPDDPDAVSRILTQRHEHLVDACMESRGIEAYVPESGDNADGHVNAETMGSMSLEDRQAWVEAWRGTGNGGEPGCVDQFNELVYPLAAFPELAPYLNSILDDPRFIEAGRRYDACMAQYPLGTNDLPDVQATTDCSQPLEEVRHTVYREQVIAFLEVHYKEVADFGRRSAAR
ncbi:MAG: hypothetical protein Q8K82_10775 [Gemmatimonadaceae bacterium]|nr:hypothetical protein [Gemmatimonadaceae bacterium]